MMKNYKRPWLWLPASVSHSLGPFFLKLHGSFRSYKTYSWNSFEWRGLKFANRLGLAAGMDKDGAHIGDWWTLGAGFLEIGTIVPKAQSPNSGILLDRDNHLQALWNRMGFPSRGVESFKHTLSKYADRHHTPIFVNIGKNRSTPLESAADDYVHLINDLDLFADAFVINISSPNTQGLRTLLSREYLQNFLGPIIEKRNQIGTTPLLLKLSPDLSDQELEFCLLQSLKMNIDGWVITNTTLTRPKGSRFPTDGGVSGTPLANLSKEVLRKTVKILGDQRGDRLIVSVGGVMSSEDVFERLEMGADLVEIFTALIFEGPFFFKNAAHEYRTRHQ